MAFMLSRQQFYAIWLPSIKCWTYILGETMPPLCRNHLVPERIHQIRSKPIHKNPVASRDAMWGIYQRSAAMNLHSVCLIIFLGPNQFVQNFDPQNSILRERRRRLGKLVLKWETLSNPLCVQCAGLFLLHQNDFHQIHSPHQP